MQHIPSRWPFALFFLSGFSALLYQIVWLRLAFASFGIVTPVMSIVISVFMLGLGLGAWLAGAMTERWIRTRSSALRAYALAEFLIGCGGLVVPLLFGVGESLLLPAGDTDSAQYLAGSAGILSLALVPFCVCMGLTYPLMLQAMRRDRADPRSFSYLYLANVVGAMCGTLAAPVLLIELLGFRGALWVAVAANWFAAGASLWLSGKLPRLGPEPASAASPRVCATAISAHRGPAFTHLLLFTTGLTSMGVEVVWARGFTPVLKTQVYSFASLLFVYLLATWCGSWLYRRHLARQRDLPLHILLPALALFAGGQILAADPRIAWRTEWMQIAWVLAGIVPYSGALGYLTPKLIDEYSAGHPGTAGRAYALNILGCVIGPLLASYVLLPRIGVQWSYLVLAAPLWMFATFALRFRGRTARRPRYTAVGISSWASAAICLVIAGTLGTSYEDQYAGPETLILRDHTATVIVTELDGGRQLMVNGKRITSITPTTKLMAHLPLAHLAHPPRSALVICFGMGTTYRSLLSWRIQTTAVELVPSVRDAFGEFFSDAEELRRDPLGRIVIDDGRRYLRRTTQQFDVITLDPPPPVEAAGSSLLYSTQFYETMRPRLSEQGILHQWFPGGELTTFQAVLRSVSSVFPHLRVMRAWDGWGYHILASEHPIPVRTAAELAARLPEQARKDVVEWTPDRTAESLFKATVEAEFAASGVLHPDPRVIITDNQPYNEYYLLRRAWQWWTGTYTIVL